MPKLPAEKELSLQTKLLEKRRRIRGQDGELKNSPNQIISMVKKEGLTYLGHGTENVVIEKENNPSSVTALGYEHDRVIGPKNYKAVYYANRLLKILFPNNFLEIKTAWDFQNANNDSAFGTIRERKPKTNKDISFSDQNQSTFLAEEALLDMEKDASAKITSVTEFLRTNQIPIGLDLLNKGNVFLNQDGNVVYMDVPDLEGTRPTDWINSLKPILEHMQREEYGQQKIDFVFNSIVRIIASSKRDKTFNKVEEMQFLNKQREKIEDLNMNQGNKDYLIQIIDKIIKIYEKYRFNS